MFKVIDLNGDVEVAYGIHVDEDGDVQFVLCDAQGIFYVTDSIPGYYKLYTVDRMESE